MKLKAYQKLYLWTAVNCVAFGFLLYVNWKIALGVGVMILAQNTIRKLNL